MIQQSLQTGWDLTWDCNVSSVRLRYFIVNKFQTNAQREKSAIYMHGLYLYKVVKDCCACCTPEAAKLSRVL